MSEDEAPASGTILLADDNPQILGMLAARLEKRGYTILTAGDGEEALELARTKAPLKQNETTAQIKVVVLTAIGESINEMTSPLYGADAYLDKPFDFAELERTIRELIG
jgi:DNA-binding response OmpR family regulator